MTVNSKMAEIIFYFCMCFEIWASGLMVWWALSVSKATGVEGMFLLLPDTPKCVNGPETLLDINISVCRFPALAANTNYNS